MKTTGSKHEESDTGTSFPEEKIVSSDTVDSKIRTKDTMASLPKKGQTVPSSSLDGKVWLSYIPRERGTGNSEPLTHE